LAQEPIEITQRGSGHLVVDLAQRRRHLVAERAGDDHHVGLARARPEDHAEAVEVVAAGRRVCIISTAQQASPKVIGHSCRSAPS
jgi:hypothetical protein